MTDSDSPRIAMLRSFDHDAHDLFRDAVGADDVDFRGYTPDSLDGTRLADLLNGLQYPSYDVFIVEGSAPLYAAVVNRVTADTTVLYLAADQGMYRLATPGSASDRSSPITAALERSGGMGVSAIASRYVDGVLALSDLIADYSRAVLGRDIPTAVVYPPVQPAVFDTLGEVTPAVDGTTVVTIAHDEHSKGVDLLVDAWPAVRRQHPDARLRIVGAGHPDEYATTPGVERVGYVDDVSTVFQSAALYVQPSRIDAFATAVAESMRAGVPPLVTSTTGARAEARAIDQSLVVDPTPMALADGVITYLNRPVDERRQLAETARRRGEQFDPAVRKAAFAEAVRSMVNRETVENPASNDQ